MPATSGTMSNCPSISRATMSSDGVQMLSGVTGVLFIRTSEMPGVYAWGGIGERPGGRYWSVAVERICYNTPLQAPDHGATVTDALYKV